MNRERNNGIEWDQKGRKLTGKEIMGKDWGKEDRNNGKG